MDMCGRPSLFATRIVGDLRRQAKQPETPSCVSFQKLFATDMPRRTNLPPFQHSYNFEIYM